MKMLAWVRRNWAIVASVFFISSLAYAATPSTPVDITNIPLFTAGNPGVVSGTVTASGGLTDAQLRATPVPISGTVTASGPLTDTQLRATAVPISGTVQPGNTPNTTPWLVTPIPSAAAGAGATPVVTSVAASSLVLKASAGNLYGVELTTAGTAGYLLIYNLAAAPVDGTVTPIYCKAIAANSSVEISWAGAPAVFATGITAAFSSTGCFTQTLSATAFISGMVK